MNNIITIDTEYLRPKFAASHLIIEQDEAAFIDVGTTLSVPILMEALKKNHIAVEKVKYVYVTHVHLDHAGGAGQLLKILPNASLVVHPKGARHMIDPAKLIKGATAVYGQDKMAENFGEIAPVNKDRIIEAEHGLTLNIKGRPFVCLDTPGHARHHFSLYDEKSHSIFSGDIFGLSYREFDTDQGVFIFPTTSPVQFDPQAMKNSIQLILSYNTQSIYLTHFGRVTQPDRLGKVLIETIDQYVELAIRFQNVGPKRLAMIMEGIEKLMLQGIHEIGCTLSEERCKALIAFDVLMNAKGLDVWVESL